jgi:fructosamine-3-kinase
MTTPLPAELRAGLVRLGLVERDQLVEGEPVAGGVSSEIWRADLPEGPVCVKRALGRLRVAANWTVPTNRTSFEAAWLAAAGEVMPEAACPVIGFAVADRVLVLRWLDPATHPVWKAQLLGGQVDASVAAELGRRIAAMHAGLSGESSWRGVFDAGDLFQALRLNPYLRVTGERYPRYRAALEDLARRTAATGRTVIHGDVSPKNVLVGPAGPLLVDAECATWGDPAFDLAFCANHLLLKAVCMPPLSPALHQAFNALVATYLAGVSWEPAADLEGRAASLLPALALARVDGASPVEYLDEQHGRPQVRAWALPLLERPPTRMGEVASGWFPHVHAAVAR